MLRRDRKAHVLRLQSAVKAFTSSTDSLARVRLFAPVSRPFDGEPPPAS